MSSSIGYVAIPLNKLRSIFEHSDRGINSEAQTRPQYAGLLHRPPPLHRRVRPWKAVFTPFRALPCFTHTQHRSISLHALQAECRMRQICWRAAGIPRICFPFTDPGAELAFAIIDAKKQPARPSCRCCLRKSRPYRMGGYPLSRPFPACACAKIITEGVFSPPLSCPRPKKVCGRMAVRTTD